MDERTPRQKYNDAKEDLEHDFAQRIYRARVWFFESMMRLGNPPTEDGVADDGTMELAAGARE